MKNLCFSLFAMIIYVSVSAQTNPIAYSLSNATFDFQGINDPSSSVYADFMAGWNLPQVAGVDAGDGSFGTDIHPDGDFELGGKGTGNLGQITNEGFPEGISIKSGCEDVNPFAIAVAMNTIGCKEISIYWEAYLIADAPNVDGRLQLQYRLDDISDWTSVVDDNYVATTGLVGDTTKFGPTLLPVDVEEKPYIQFRWMTYQIQSELASFCNNDHIGIKRIKIESAQTTPQLPSTNFVVSKESVLINEPIEFTDKTTGSPTDYLWDFGDSTTSDTKSPIKVYQTSGVYTVSLTATNGVGSTTETKEGYITVEAQTSIATNNTFNMSVYPNPTSDFLNINTDRLVKYVIYNAIGQKVLNGQTSKSINVSELTPGTYSVDIETGSEKMVNKFVVN
ncbi:MAG: PKD repeat protein [Sphingobacteriales bacterium]|jgi:PKD repeat protein